MDSNTVSCITSGLVQINTIVTAAIALIGTVAGFFAGFKHGNNKRRRAVEKKIQ